MDWQTFVVELVKALAWPVTVGVVTLALWKHIIPLFSRLRGVKYREVELSFEAVLLQASEDAVKALPRSAPGLAPITPETDRLNRLLELSPRAAVLEAFVPIQTALASLARSHGVTVGRVGYYSASAIADALLATGVISESQRSLFAKLRRLRNAAAHAPEFTESADAVREYIGLSSGLAAAFRDQAA